MTKFSTTDVKSTSQDKTRRVKRKTVKRKQEKDDGCCRCITQYVMLIVMVFGLTFLYLKQYKYNRHFTSVSGSGELSVRHFVDDLNTMMCQDYKLSDWKPLDVYLTSGKARVDKKTRSIIKRSGGQLYPSGILTDNSFYLLKGSNLKMNACRNHDSGQDERNAVDLLLFKGDNSWDKFKSGTCSDCTEMNTSVPLNLMCDVDVITTYTVGERDTYYIAIVDRNKGYNTFYLDVSADLMINRTTFDTKDSQMICTQESECLVPLKYNEDVDVVISFSDDTFVTSECKFRTTFCVGIFVVFPACLLILGFTCCGVCAMFGRQEKRSKTSKQPNISTIEGQEADHKDKSGLVINELPPSYDTLNDV